MNSSPQPFHFSQRGHLDLDLVDLLGPPWPPASRGWCSMLWRLKRGYWV